MKKSKGISTEQTSLFSAGSFVLTPGPDLVEVDKTPVKTIHAFDKIYLPDDARYVAQGLYKPVSVVSGFPEVLRDVAGYRRILYETDGNLGIDFEGKELGRPGSPKPTVMGLASRGLSCAIPWNDELLRETVEVAGRGRHLIGHAVIGSDRPALEMFLGIKTPRALWRDSMLTHFLCNSDFSKAPGKEADEGSLGFNNLWTAASMVLRVPNWKVCAGRGCPEIICPRHDVWGYCAIDSWAGLEIYEENWAELMRFGLPPEYYDDFLELAEICDIMENRGVNIDHDKVAMLRIEMSQQKDKIFDYDMVGGNKQYARFNPNSAEQVKDWFGARGVKLEKNDKKTIQKALEKTLEKFGYASKDDVPDDGIPETLEALLDLHEFKESGKGPDPWFGPKYIHKDHLVHPRMICTGASSGRWASSSPNFTNIGKRGWAARLKGCVIPMSEDSDFIASDSSQLELRIMLHQAGYDPGMAKGIFEGLVENSNGAYAKAAEAAHQSERDVSKSIVHATDYLESFKLMDPIDLKRENVKSMIAAGALEVHKDWEFMGKIVTFTGVNLAERILGDKSYEKRALALKLRRGFLDQFPKLEEFQRRTLNFVQDNGYVRTPSGRYLRLYGKDEDNAKIAMATIGQGGGAEYVQGTILRFRRERDAIPTLFVHDELTFEIPKRWSDGAAQEFMSLMYEETNRIPGFKAPGECKRGGNYGKKSEDNPKGLRSLIL